MRLTITASHNLSLQLETDTWKWTAVSGELSTRTAKALNAAVPPEAGAHATPLSLARDAVATMGFQGIVVTIADALSRELSPPGEDCFAATEDPAA